MLIAIDVGNSTTVLGVFVGDELVDHWRLSTVARRTPDEWSSLIHGVFGPAGRTLGAEPDGLVIGSVVPAVTDALRQMSARYVDVAPVIVEPGVRTGIAIRHDNPKELGADRIANAVAAAALFGGPAIVVDFGTATSFDVVDADGAFVGGAIAPGVSTATDALIERAARLPEVELVTPPSPIGRSTVTALQSGAVFGFAGQVDGIVARITQTLGAGVTVVATGGVAPAVLDACTTIDHHDPWLTLKGLQRIWSNNR
ncbi:MAG: type III pantothenate kinase [Nitriliruptoraceae bacterium]